MQNLSEETFGCSNIVWDVCVCEIEDFISVLLCISIMQREIVNQDCFDGLCMLFKG